MFDHSYKPVDLSKRQRKVTCRFSDRAPAEWFWSGVSVAVLAGFVIVEVLARF